METFPFWKMSGSGNDFIIVDNRNGIVDVEHIERFIARICRRNMSVGSDGFILVEDAPHVDFKWRFYNSDGSPAEMCGNGARCAARFAYLNKIAGPEMSFETAAGIIHATLKDDRVKINLTPPRELRLDYEIALESGPLSVCSVNTGVPHAVVAVDDLEGTPVAALGREIRFHEQFAPAGTNVNFIRIRSGNRIDIRTYERGVEDETLACGTGAVASAIVAAARFGKQSPIDVSPKSGGHLYIYFSEADGRFGDVYLEGDARVIYTGELWPDAWA